MNCAYYNDTQSECSLAPDERTRSDCVDCEHKNPAKKRTAKIAPTATPTIATLIASDINMRSQECPNCVRLREVINRLETRLAKYQKFEAAQKGHRARSKRIAKLLDSKDMVCALKAAGISNRKQAALWECSEISIRRLLAGTLTNDNP